MNRNYVNHVIEAMRNSRRTTDVLLNRVARENKAVFIIDRNRRKPNTTADTVHTALRGLPPDQPVILSSGESVRMLTQCLDQIHTLLTLVGPETLQTVRINRDAETGQWTHPDLPDLGEGFDLYEQWFAVRGQKLTVTFMRSELEGTGTDCRPYDEMGDFSFWNPTWSGDMLVSIHDNEEGPCAWWISPLGS